VRRIRGPFDSPEASNRLIGCRRPYRWRWFIVGTYVPRSKLRVIRSYLRSSSHDMLAGDMRYRLYDRARGLQTRSGVSDIGRGEGCSDRGFLTALFRITSAYSFIDRFKLPRRKLADLLTGATNSCGFDRRRNFSTFSDLACSP
jgi:hypothetical protein